MNHIIITDKWIPTSKELPDHQVQVIISVLDTVGDTPFAYTAVGWITRQGVWIVENRVCEHDVIAWLPMPEPYKNQ